MLIPPHETGFARDVADEVCFLDEGAILERGAPAAVLEARFLRRLLAARAP
jgi:ABC-type histidine transport system ATPase subunit